ncbi:MAG: hypothetical protein AAF737_04145 [Pseudomonadota bacterium]
MANTAISKIAAETVMWGFIPMMRSSLKANMDRAGYDKHGFGSSDYWAWGRKSVDHPPLKIDAARKAFEALERDDVEAADAIVRDFPASYEVAA